MTHEHNGGPAFPFGQIISEVTGLLVKPRNSSAGMDSVAGASHGAQAELNHGVDRSEAQPQLPGTV